MGEIFLEDFWSGQVVQDGQKKLVSKNPQHLFPHLTHLTQHRKAHAGHGRIPEESRLAQALSNAGREGAGVGVGRAGVGLSVQTPDRCVAGGARPSCHVP